MGRFMLVCFGVVLLATAATALLKVLFIVVGMVMILALLAGLYRLRPAACLAVCIAAGVALLPKAVWPWLGLAAMIWLAIEVLYAIYRRMRRPSVPQLSSV